MVLRKRMLGTFSPQYKKCTTNPYHSFSPLSRAEGRKSQEKKYLTKTKHGGRVAPPKVENVKNFFQKKALDKLTNAW